MFYSLPRKFPQSWIGYTDASRAMDSIGRRPHNDWYRPRHMLVSARLIASFSSIFSTHANPSSP